MWQFLEAFDKLKELLCKATMNPLQIVDFTKPFKIHVDARDYADERRQKISQWLKFLFFFFLTVFFSVQLV